jgi:hypothetical protein
MLARSAWGRVLDLLFGSSERELALFDFYCFYLLFQVFIVSILYKYLHVL